MPKALRLYRREEIDFIINSDIKDPLGQETEVEMKHQGAEKVREQTRGMTLEQELASWQERSLILKQRQKITKREERMPADEVQRAS